MGRALPVMFNLDDIQIASPCKMGWQDMTGSDRVRHCAACQKNVFNLSGMKRSEATELVRATEGNVCARFYRRKDGTILTADCDVGLALVARRAKRAVLGALVSSLGLVGAVLAFLATTPMRRGVDVVGARDAVTLKVTELTHTIDALVVPEEPHIEMAGGISAPMEPRMGLVSVPTD